MLIKKIYQKFPKNKGCIINGVDEKCFLNTIFFTKKSGDNESFLLKCNRETQFKRSDFIVSFRFYQSSFRFTRP